LRALEGIADAVYFGVAGGLHMRARASTFGFEDLGGVVDWCHGHGIRAYLTSNIVYYDDDIAPLMELFTRARDAGVDAVIVHDLGALQTAREHSLETHISTQANVTNTLAARRYETLGAARIILARELSLTQVAGIVDGLTAADAEVFVHGAMCTAYSGRCYFSAQAKGFAAEYSANRGRCTQPCRWTYEVTGEGGDRYDVEQMTEGGRTRTALFNAKDLCMIEHLPDLLATGVRSLKIEGRMRDPLYVAEAARCYREALDAMTAGAYTADAVVGWLARLTRVFNRGFHTGFYYSTPGPREVEPLVRGNVSPWHRDKIGATTGTDEVPPTFALRPGATLNPGDELIVEGTAREIFIRVTYCGSPAVGPSPGDPTATPVLVELPVESTLPSGCLVYRFNPRVPNPSCQNTQTD
jgi:putative protease